jgi:hypothetical protein
MFGPNHAIESQFGFLLDPYVVREAVSTSKGGGLPA